MLRCLMVVAALSVVIAWSAAVAQDTILVEAESFAQRGGWVVDQQSMDQIGSAYLMAHGLGEPVADAVTTVRIPAAGKYRVLVRTRDWAAPWKTAVAPGKFKLLIAGKPLETTFGTEGAEWHWQSGGAVDLAAGDVKLALHDLTGFNGRCDAILLTSDEKLTPPKAGEELAAFRRKLLGLPDVPPDGGKFDLVVVGGGIAGTCAAVSAARLGLSVALVQNRPVLGGNNSSEIRVHLNGNINQKPYPALGGIVKELDPGQRGNARPAENYNDQKKLDVVQAEKRITLLLNQHVFRAQTDGKRIVSVDARDIETGREVRLSGRWFADCTGDANLGFLAGADYYYGREPKDETQEKLAPEKPDRLVMGSSVQWYSVVDENPKPFLETPWAIQFNEKTYQKAKMGDWNWETGFRWDQAGETERIRDHGLRAVFGNWSYQRNHAPDKQNYADRKLGWVAYITGKRESRRLMGDVVLTQQDIVDARAFSDASVTTTWTIDLHYPIGSQDFPGEEFRSKAEHVRFPPYPIPYRCLYSRNVENLFMAGRNISVTHIALGTTRVMRTCGMMGEVVGMAASICKTHETTPRGVYEKHIDELKQLMTRGVGKSQ